jgi:pyruvate, water dikinase
MSSQLERFAAAFHPRPVVYRAMDFRSNEFRGLRAVIVSSRKRRTR